MKTIAVKSMNIAILGAGAMGSLFGGYLSRFNNVYLIDTSFAIIDKIKSTGLLITEADETSNYYKVLATNDAKNLDNFKADLIIVFVKGMHSADALKSIKHILTDNTFLLSFQNGIGHEYIMSEFVKPEKVLIGTTQHVCSVISPGHVKHSGSGITWVGRLSGVTNEIKPFTENFNKCGINTKITENYKTQVWEKLFTNVSASALTGALQVPLGFIVDNEFAWDMCQQLIYEALMVAKADGAIFDSEEEVAKVRKVCENSPHGLTSIYSDLSQGRKSEVDTISGSIVRLAQKYEINVPHNEVLVKIIHALEGKNINIATGGSE